MSWVVKLGVGAAIAGALLAASFLLRRQWVLRWHGYQVVVRSSPLRVVMRIDGDEVAARWRRPGAPAQLQALVEDSQHGLLAFRTSVEGLRPRCRIDVNGERLGGERLGGGPLARRGEEPQDPRWAEVRELLLALRERSGDSPRVLAAAEGLGALTRGGLETLEALRGAADGPGRSQVRVFQHEVELLLAAVRDLCRADGGEIEGALDRAERLIASLTSRRQAPRTFQLKPAGHSGSARIVRRRATRSREEPE